MAHDERLEPPFDRLRQLRRPHEVHPLQGPRITQIRDPGNPEPSLEQQPDEVSGVWRARREDGIEALVPHEARRRPRMRVESIPPRRRHGQQCQGLAAESPAPPVLRRSRLRLADLLLRVTDLARVRPWNLLTPLYASRTRRSSWRGLGHAPVLRMRMEGGGPAGSVAAYCRDVHGEDGGLPAEFGQKATELGRTGSTGREFGGE